MPIKHAKVSTIADGEDDTLIQGSDWNADHVGSIDIGARVYASADITGLANNTEYPIPFDSEDYDTDTIHDNSTNNSRLTCKTAGKYIITGSFATTLNNTAFSIIGIKKNGAGPYIAEFKGVASRYNVSGLCELAVNDYVELCFYNLSGGEATIWGGSGNTLNFAMQKIG